MIDSGLGIFRVNLHVHTCLSPCGDLDMHPRALVDEAVAQGLDMIAVCDHNASENVPYVMNAARGTRLTVLPGMEVCTREEAHVLALFGDLPSLARLQDYVYENLTGLNDEEAFGMQPIVNEHGEVEGFNERLLIGATGISLENLVERIHGCGGIAIAAHIDRPSFSVVGQLGFIPPHLAFDALEVSRRLGIREGRSRYPELEAYPLVTSSDAHFIADIGSVYTRMVLEKPAFEELLKAIRKQDGRCILEDGE
ncbi:MAG: PHP domain-containing protein [Desulfomonilia bacterium]|jgi:PHP family Zn ribbon phosphoesterase